MGLTKIDSEPEFIEGPVNFIYLKGDPGDGVKSKVLLLSDLHFSIKPCEVNTAMSAANFCQYVAERSAPQVIDLFIESFHHGSLYSPAEKR